MVLVASHAEGYIRYSGGNGLCCVIMVCLYFEQKTRRSRREGGSEKPDQTRDEIKEFTSRTIQSNPKLTI